ncbi:hypothetical protein OPT61_g2549 [Boeremia exigua]|uniref:Uncharacterized protein n=1 Tax=Boeremia exigua TaxID=749465 RepID=A0ACC2IL21_9PLEO|nr:hypothetical protein OPT61_g2549 [Boeremia exigua]
MTKWRVCDIVGKACRSKMWRPRSPRGKFEASLPKEEQPVQSGLTARLLWTTFITAAFTELPRASSDATRKLRGRQISAAYRLEGIRTKREPSMNNSLLHTDTALPSAEISYDHGIVLLTSRGDHGVATKTLA